MNIWSLNKDNTIKHLLLLLENEVGEGAFDIISNTEDDLRAVRLINPADACMSIYVYTYGQEEDHYGVHIEYPDLTETNSSDTLEIYDNLNFDVLIEILTNDLGIETRKSVASGGQ